RSICLPSCRPLPRVRTNDEIRTSKSEIRNSNVERNPNNHDRKLFERLGGSGAFRAFSFIRHSALVIRICPPRGSLSMSERPSTLMPARLRPLIWPLIALAALLLFNGVFTEGFARITIKDGHVYGSLVDMLKLSSRVMLVSLGMTLIIATAGVDLSVGAVVAIAGSLAAKLLVQEQAGLPL